MISNKLTNSAVELVKELNRRSINLHSVLITCDGETVFEEYAEPFNAESNHRMYSVTKSFVAVAVGALIDEGKLKLTDKVADYFKDKMPQNLPSELASMTVREMLTMKTCFSGINWFKPGVTDRTAFYFEQPPVKPAGTVFSYDSSGTYIMGALVERLSGMPLLDYMKSRFLDEIGGFENAEMLCVPDGTAWSDSALLCTPRALERFARFVMQKGCWNGKQLISRKYMEDATSKQSATGSGGYTSYDGDGYGYYIWTYKDISFSFEGMGGQQAIVFPEQKLIFVCTGDNQYIPHYYEILYNAVFKAFGADCDIDGHSSTLTLKTAQGGSESPLEAQINGKKFVCKQNPMGLRYFRLNFNKTGGVFEYENADGVKFLPFGRKQNVECKFPELGYSDGYGNVHEKNGFMYNCIVSAGWTEQNQLQIKVQVIDRYFGALHMTFGFRDADTCGIRMAKNAEDFFNEYNGWAIAYAE